MRPTGEIVLDATGLGKTYRVGSVRALVGGGTGAADAAHVALEGVDLAIPRGTGFGIVGANGAGKSTLLRLLAGLARPTSGRLRCRGRRGALLELGAGFLDEVDGEANARIALSLGGLAGRELDGAIAAAAEFADLGDFLREPIRVYSAGMRLRLAYAVVVALDPEILLVDEVLAVGDEAFQRKCSRHIVGFLERGGTLVLASHNLYQVEKLCDRAAWLAAGRVAAAGAVRDVTTAYRTHVEDRARTAEPIDGDAPPLARVEVESGRGAGEGGFAVLVDACADTESLRLEICTLDGTLVAALPVPAGAARLHVRQPRLLPGGYRARLRGERSGRLHAEHRFQLSGQSRELGRVHLDHRWG